MHAEDRDAAARLGSGLSYSPSCCATIAANATPAVRSCVGPPVPRNQPCSADSLWHGSVRRFRGSRRHADVIGECHGGRRNQRIRCVSAGIEEHGEEETRVRSDQVSRDAASDARALGDRSSGATVTLLWMGTIIRGTKSSRP